MDPNETLRLLAEAINNKNPILIYQHIDNLHIWLSRGGFEPDWAKYPVAANKYFSARDAHYKTQHWLWRKLYTACKQLTTSLSSESFWVDEELNALGEIEAALSLIDEASKSTNAK